MNEPRLVLLVVWTKGLQLFVAMVTTPKLNPPSYMCTHLFSSVGRVKTVEEYDRDRELYLQDLLKVWGGGGGVGG